jgi:hypothetical protein
MDEAKFSITTKYTIGGFDTMLTMRDDRSVKELLKAHKAALELLVKQGATTGRSSSNGEKLNPGATKQAGNGEAPVCPTHGVSRQGKRGYFCPTKLPDGSYCQWEA